MIRIENAEEISLGRKKWRNIVVTTIDFRGLNVTKRKIYIYIHIICHQ